MKVAIIRNECSYTKGGAERYAANLAKCLCEQGHEVTVLAERYDDSVHPQINFVPIKVNRFSSASRTRSFHENSQAALKNIKADQVIALSRSFPSDAFRISDPIHRFWMEIRYPNPLNRFLQSLNPRHRTILKTEKQIIDPANTRIIVTNSELSKRLIAEYYPDYPQDKIHVIYNGVDLEKFAPGAPPEESETLNFLFVGHDFKRKGLSAVITAVANATEKGLKCHLRVIGRDKPESYQAQAESLGVGRFVTFEGATSSIQNAYASADLFIFPSLYDPFANVVLEALACGAPTLTTTTNGSSEIIEEGINGYVVDYPSDALASDIADRLMKFGQLDFSSRLEMRKHAREKAEAFTIEQNANNVIKALTES